MQLTRDIEDVRALADTIRLCRNGGCRDEEGVERKLGCSACEKSYADGCMILARRIINKLTPEELNVA